MSYLLFEKAWDALRFKYLPADSFLGGVDCFDEEIGPSVVVRLDPWAGPDAAGALSKIKIYQGISTNYSSNTIEFDS